MNYKIKYFSFKNQMSGGANSAYGYGEMHIPRSSICATYWAAPKNDCSVWKHPENIFRDPEWSTGHRSWVVLNFQVSYPILS